MAISLGIYPIFRQTHIYIYMWYWLILDIIPAITAIIEAQRCCWFLLMTGPTPRKDAKAEAVDPHCPNWLPYIGGSMHINTTISEPTYHMDSYGWWHFLLYSVWCPHVAMVFQIFRYVWISKNTSATQSKGHFGGRYPGWRRNDLPSSRSSSNLSLKNPDYCTYSNLLTKYTPNISKSQHFKAWIFPGKNDLIWPGNAEPQEPPERPVFPWAVRRTCRHGFVLREFFSNWWWVKDLSNSGTDTLWLWLT